MRPPTMWVPVSNQAKSIKAPKQQVACANAIDKCNRSMEYVMGFAQKLRISIDLP